MPLFSVIIPTYNRSCLILRAVDSVLVQAFTDMEIIVVDDGSTDDTAAIIAGIGSAQVKYFFQENKGVSAARNTGVSKASGDYLIFLDSDDMLTEDSLREYKSQIENSECELVFCDMRVINTVSNYERVVSSRNPYRNFPSSGIYASGTFCIRRQLFQDAGGYDESMKYGENTELKFRINKLRPKFSFTDKVGLLYYQSDSGGSKNLANIIASNTHMIKKHSDVFSKHPLLTMRYRRVIATAQFKTGKYSQARKEMWLACRACPYEFKNYIRLMMYFFPAISKKII